MSKYTEEFKIKLVQLAESGQTTVEIAAKYNVDRSSINKWRKAYNSTAKTLASKKLSSEQREILELSKQLKELQQERDILKKAADFFSKNE